VVAVRGRDIVGSSATRVLSVMLALVLVASSVGCGGEQPPGGEPEGLGTSWTRVEHDDAVFGAEGEGYVGMISATAGGPGYVAVGWAGTDDAADAGTVAVWTSPDGRTWTRVPDDDGVFAGSGSTSINAVAAGGPGLVAVGTEHRPNGLAGGAVWVSPDGVTWTRVTESDDVFVGPDDTSLLDVTAGGPGLVAVGTIREADGRELDRDEDRGDGGGPEDRGDGDGPEDPGDGEGPEERGWDDDPQPPDEDEEWDAEPWGDEASPPEEEWWDEEPLEDEQEWLDKEMLLDEEEDPDAMMEEARSGPREVAAVWTSEDGRRWTRVPHVDATFATAHTQSMVSVSTGGPGLVAVGNAMREAGFGWAAAVWTSEDGASWNRLPHDEDVFGGDGMPGMHAVAEGGRGVVAVGSSHWSYLDPEPGWFAAAWTSPDGVNWTRAPHDEDAFVSTGFPMMTDVIAAGPGLVAVGSVFELTSEEFVTRMVGAVWTSEDGTVWSRLPHDEVVFGGADEVGMQSVVAGPSGLVAVGVVGFDAENGPPGSTVAAVWTSP
jgi:hypothetical protein